MQSEIMEELGVSKLKQYEAYLGLSALVGRNKRASFDKLKQKVWKRLQVWEGKLLSQAGREVLIKSVIQAFRLTQWVALSYQPPYVMRLKLLFGNFGGDKGVTREKFMGLGGRIYVTIKTKKEWVSRISSCSTKQCWQSSHGSFAKMIIHCSWMRRNPLLLHMLGEASSMGGM